MNDEHIKVIIIHVYEMVNITNIDSQVFWKSTADTATKRDTYNAIRHSKKETLKQYNFLSIVNISAKDRCY